MGWVRVIMEVWSLSCMLVPYPLSWSPVCGTLQLGMSKYCTWERFYSVRLLVKSRVGPKKKRTWGSLEKFFSKNLYKKSVWLVARISLFFFIFKPMLKLFKALLTNWPQQYYCGETMTLPSVRIYISPLSLPFNNSIFTRVLLLQIILFFLSLPCSRRQGTSVYPESSFSWVTNFFFLCEFYYPKFF